MPDLDVALRGLAAGLLAGYLVFYGLRPRSPYPAWMLVAYDQPWVLLIALAVVARLAAWDVFVGSMAFVGLVAFAADLVVFGAPARDAAAAHGEQDAEDRAGGAPADGDGDGGAIVGRAAWGAAGAASGAPIAIARVAPGLEPPYSLYPTTDPYAGELLGGPAAF